MALSRWLMVRDPAGRTRKRAAATPAGYRPMLEHLEDRAVPSTTNVVINLAPNFFAGNVTETVTATVTPSASETGPAVGTVGFTVNNQTAQVAIGNNNQATATFMLPVRSLLAGQTVEARFTATPPSTTPPTTTVPVGSSTFLSPVYLNLDNLFLQSTISFGAPPDNFTGSTDSTGTTAQFNSTFGETNRVSFFLAPVTYTYADPGIMTSANVFGITFTGFFLNTVNQNFINPFAPFVYPQQTQQISG